MIQFLFFFGLIVMSVATVYHLLTKKYLNPFKLTMIFGKKGSGKTTLLTKLAYKYRSRGWTVYTTFPIPGCRLFDVHQVGDVDFEPHSCILIDEVGMIWDNRDFKNFKKSVRDWFKLQRHYKCRVFLASQTFDIDKKLRDLTDEMYLVTCKARVFSYAKRILRKPCLVQPMGDSPARLDEELKFDTLLFAAFGARMLTFIPRWSPLFTSFDAPPLGKGVVYEDEEIPLNLPYSLRRRCGFVERKKFTWMKKK